MTQHALTRLAERAPGIAPSEAMAQIHSAITADAAPIAATGISGCHILEVRLSTGQVVFPVTTSDRKAVKTVLVAGMSVECPEGRHVLASRPLAPGVYRDLSDDQYHADPSDRPSLSSTLARVLLNQSPLHAWTQHPKLNPNWEPTDKKTFDIGRAAHRAVLGRGGDYMAIPSDLLASNGAASTKAAKDWIAEARAAGITPLKAEEVDQIGEMAAIAAQRMAENGITLDPANSEAVVLAEIGGVPCRAMVDNAPTDPSQPLYDFKTCVDASPAACVRAVMNYGYDVQAQHYLDCWKAATGEERLFRFIFQEKSAPYEVCVVQMGNESLMMASKKTARAREIWGNCTRTDHWPGYPDGVVSIELPEFYHAKWLERESAEADHKRHYGRDVLDAAGRWQAPQGYAAE